MMVLLAIFALVTSQTPHGDPLRDMPLFARARKFEKARLNDFDNYAWIDNNRVLVECNGNNKENRFVINGGMAPAKPSLKRLNRVFATIPLRLYHWTLSPDGKRLLWMFGWAGIVIELDGSRRRDVGATGHHAYNYWLGDSRHMLHAAYGANGNVFKYYDLTLYDASKSRYEFKLDNSANNPLYSGHTVDVGSANGAIFTVNRTGESSENITSRLLIHRRRLDGRQNRTRTWPIDLKDEKHDHLSGVVTGLPKSGRHSRGGGAPAIQSSEE
jgi:hypothetical protein